MPTEGWGVFKNKAEKRKRPMAQKKSQHKRPIESYEHRDKERLNNPPAGLVTP